MLILVTLKAVKWKRTILWLGFVVAAGWWVYNACCLYIDHDEIEHIHDAYLVFRGLVPFRDFVEVHQPLLWFLLAPVFALTTNPVTVIFIVRGLFVVFFGLALWLVYDMAKPSFFALLGLITAASSMLYVRSFVEVRNDGPMVLMVLLAMWLLYRFRKDSHRMIFLPLSGLAMGLAMLFSNKAVPAGVGLLVGVWLSQRDMNASQRWSGMVRFVAAVLLPWVFLLVYLSMTDSMLCYIFWTYQLNMLMHVKAHFPFAFNVGRTILAFMRYDPALVVLVVVGLAFGFTRLGDPLVATSLVTLVLGMGLAYESLLPYKQYLLLPITMGVFLGLRFLAYLGQRKARLSAILGLVLAVVALGRGSWLWLNGITTNTTQIAAIRAMDRVLPMDARVLCMPPRHPITRLDASPLWFNLDLFDRCFSAARHTGLPDLDCIKRALSVPATPPDAIGGISTARFVRLAGATGATRGYYARLRPFQGLFVRSTFLRAKHANGQGRPQQ